MAADEKWYFTKEQLGNTPSRKCGIDADKELSYRQQAANFIQDMGQRLSVTQLCINTAIVYMHRFYVFHSLSQFHRNAIASAALFLAAKVEEQPRKLEHVIKVAHMCLHRDQTPPDTRSEQYLEQAQDLVFNENVLLQTLGFDVAIDHPHTHVVRCCHLVKASKDLAQTSYFMASNSLHLTTMCLQYKPTVVACFCIHLACKWSNWEIPQSNEGKDWFWYVDSSVTGKQLQQLTAEFLHIFDKCPSRLKRKIMSISANQSPSINHPSLPNSPFDAEPRRVQSPATDGGPTFQSSRPFPPEDPKKPLASSSTSSSRPPVDYREYREKKERERLEREKAAVAAAAGVPNASAMAMEVPPQKPHHSHSHHAKQQAASSSQPSSSSGKHPSGPGTKPNMHHNHHGAHRTDAKLGATSQPSQRHSSSTSCSAGQSSRPRMPRDYNAALVNPANQTSIYSHGHHPKEAQITNSEQPEMSVSNVELAPNIEKLNHSREKHEKPGQRGYDPRNKILEHRSKDSEQKAYVKYQQEQQQQQQQQQQQAARSRKVGQDSVEQRSEEVRKIIDKPIAPPKAPMKPEVVLQREDYIASMLKQPHNPKAAIAAANPTRNHQDYGMLPVTREKTSIGKNSQHGSSKYDKSEVKNGNSEEKRIQAQSLQQPAQSVKHKSIFSPEKTTPRESRVSRQTRQKTPPSSSNSGAMKSSKLQERVPDPMGSLDLAAFGTSAIPQIVNQSMNQTSQQQQPQQQQQQQQQHKRHRTSSISDSANNLTKPTIKMEIDENRENYETMKMLGRVPELIQPIRDNPSSTNGRSSHSSVANDLKPPELIKPFEPEPIGRHTSLTNGLEVQKREDLSRASPDSGFGTQPMKNSQDYLSPMKTAQSISALLQEPLAPMPSLLQGITDFDVPQASSQQSQHHEETLNNKNLQSQRYHQFEHEDRSSVPFVTAVGIKDEKEVLSTVDISALSAPVQTIPEPEDPTLDNTLLTASNNDETSSTTSAATTTIVETTSTSRKSDHHKSEKKKKKEKHKHKEKDKEKSREKRKHKHKDKEKEKPITIKIPKNKLNMPSTEQSVTSQAQTSSQDKTSPQTTTGLKIKIPKERLQETVSQPVQGSLKMKIRTGGDTAESSVSVSTSSSSTSLYASVSTNSSRKRDRNETGSDATPSGPPTKKQLHHHTAQNPTISSYGTQQQQHLQQQQQQHVQQKQNGRHYSSNNKVRGGRGARQYVPSRSSTFATTAPQTSLHLSENYYQQQQQHTLRQRTQMDMDLDIRHGNNSLNNNNSSIPDGSGINAVAQNLGRNTSNNLILGSNSGGRVFDNSYYFAHYPPPSLYNQHGGYSMYEHAMYYQQQQQFQQQQQQQFAMAAAALGIYPGNVIMTPDGAIDTSVPPPNLSGRGVRGNNGIDIANSNFEGENPPPLPSGPPPNSSPPPPPPPPE